MELVSRKGRNAIEAGFADGNQILVTRSMRRLFVLEQFSWQRRALQHVHGNTWTGGKTVLDRLHAARCSFEQSRITVHQNGNTQEFERQLKLKSRLG